MSGIRGVRVVRAIGGVALALLAGALAACDAPRAASPAIWTLFDVQALYAEGKQPSDAIATDAGLPDGVKLEKLLLGDSSTLFARPTITEGYNASYLTTEVWSHFDEVWLQPMYIPVTAWMNGGPMTLGPASWIFSVGPGSGFYSPFWQMVYFDVPEGTTPGAITSARQVLDGKYPLHFGPGRTVSLVPDGLVAPPGPPDVALVQGTAWLEGKPVSFIDFGKATFTWNENAVIDEVPIYVFVVRNATGGLAAPDIQTVAGTGPPGSGGPPAPVMGGERRYVAYWRIYTVTLPPAARVFAPDQVLREKVAATGMPVIEQYTTEAQAYETQVSGWVALNPGGENGEGGCWATGAQVEPDPMNTTAGKCIWLNSQAAIEKNIDRSAIRRTDVTVTCPFVTLDGRLVSPIK